MHPDGPTELITFLPAATRPEGRPVVLLHGTGGDETSLLPFARQVAPASALLACRGTVAIEGGYAFFRRHPDRRIDEADLKARVSPLALALTRALHAHQVSEKPVLIGYSNGAIMAAALLQLCPDLVSGAILLRVLSPYEKEPARTEPGPPVLIVDGAHDDRRAPGDGSRVATALGRAGSVISHHVLPVGHALTEGDAHLVRDWLADH